MLRRGYLDQVNFRQNTHSNSGFYHSLGLGSELQRKEKAPWALVFTKPLLPSWE